jgi:hypothetical protein
MNTLENIKATGRLAIAVIDASGNVKDAREVDNLVVTAGLGYIASRMAAATATVMSHMAIGSGSTAAAAAQASLISELGRAALTSTNVTGSQVQYVSTFGPGVGTGAVTEAGIFNGASSGTMLCRTVFSVVNKDAGDTMTITWTVTLAAS